MIKIVTCPLYKLSNSHKEMQNIANIVRKVQNLTKVIVPFKDYARRGDIIGIAYDNDELVGFTLYTKAHNYAYGPTYIPLFLWLYKNNYNIDNIGTPHAVYILPDYWKKGITTQIFDNIETYCDFERIIYIEPASNVFEQWFAARSGSIATGFTGRNKRRIFIKTNIN